MSRLENYTKDELRKELKQRGIAVPSSLSKDELIKLHRQKNSKVPKPRIEFSDEDASGRPAIRKKAQSPKKISLDTYLPGIIKMTDEELAKELREHGATPGPITNTTRSVYQKKLASMKTQHLQRTAAVSSAHKSSGREQVDYGDKDSDDKDDFSSDAELGESSNEEEDTQPRPARMPLVAEYKQVKQPSGIPRSSQGSPGKSGAVQRKPVISPAGMGRKSLIDSFADKASQPPSSSPSQETTWTSCVGQTAAILLILVLTVLLVVFMITGELPHPKMLGYNKA